MRGMVRLGVAASTNDGLPPTTLYALGHNGSRAEIPQVAAPKVADTVTRMGEAAPIGRVSGHPQLA
jgi:hypothetical protein